MKKVIVIACFSIFLNFKINAQVDSRPFVLSLAPEISLPVGKFAETNKLSAGGNIIAQFTLAEKLRLLTSIGGILYQGKSGPDESFVDAEYDAVAMLGIKGGLKYYVSNALFVAGNIGVDRVTQGGENQIGFTYNPIIGVELGGVDIFVKYNVVGVKTFNSKNIQTVGLCIGYRL